MIFVSDPKAQKHPAWPAFLEAMHDKIYGQEALDTAWAWFVTGWNCAFQSQWVTEVLAKIAQKGG